MPSNYNTNCISKVTKYINPSGFNYINRTSIHHIGKTYFMICFWGSCIFCRNAELFSGTIYANKTYIEDANGNNLFFPMSMIIFIAEKLPEMKV